MNTPRGFNPVGESAPGLPRHDAPLPGHVPGQYQPLGGGDDGSSSGFSYNVGSGDPGLPPWFGVWFGRFTYFFVNYLTVPVQVALYPIAGAAGVVAGGAAYLLMRAMGGGIERAYEWAWTGCFLGLIALMRTEIRIGDANPGYRHVRQFLRLGLCFVWMFYFSVHEQHNPAGTSFVISAIFTAIMYLVLRAKLLRGIWNALQGMAWMRKSA